MIIMNSKITIGAVYTNNNMKVRDIYNGSEYLGTEAYTPHCGWVLDDINPSLDCKKCDTNCHEYQKWKDFCLSL